MARVDLFVGELSHEITRICKTVELIFIIFVNDVYVEVKGTNVCECVCAIV